MSEKDPQAIFLETLQKLVEKAKGNKGTINIDEISIAFEGMNLPVDEIEGIYDYLKNQNIIITQGNGPVMSGEDALPDEETEEILKAHLPELHRVAQFLFEQEKMSGEQFICAMENKPIPVETDEDEEEGPAVSPEAAEADPRNE